MKRPTSTRTRTHDKTPSTRRGAVRAARPGSDDAVPPDGGGGDSAIERLAELLDQFSGESAGLRCYIERIGDDGVPKYLGAVPFNEELYDAVKSRWGGGRFGGRIIGAGNKYRGRVPTFEIGGKSRDDSDAAVVAAVPPVSEQQRVLLDAITALTAEVRNLRAAPPVAAVDPVQQVVAVATALRELTAAPAVAPSPFEGRMLEMVNDLLDLKDRVADSAPRARAESGVVEAIREVKPVLNRMLDVAERKQGRSVELAPPPERPAADIVPVWLRPFMRFKAEFLKAADQGDDPERIANGVIMLADEAAWNAIGQAEVDGRLETDLFAAVPELHASADRRQFAGKMLAVLRAALRGEPEEDVEEAPASARPKRRRG